MDSTTLVSGIPYDALLVDSINIDAYGDNRESFPPASYYTNPSLYADSVPTNLSLTANGPVFTPTSTEPYRHSITGFDPSIDGVSSTSGSPFSRDADPHEQWVDTTYGVGLPVAAMGDIFPSDCIGNPFESDHSLVEGKLTDRVVGMSPYSPQDMKVNANFLQIQQ